jgi:opacity protein-like surface antigen
MLLCATAPTTTMATTAMPAHAQEEAPVSPAQEPPPAEGAPPPPAIASLPAPTPEATSTTPSMFGLLLGIRAGTVIPGGGGTIRGPKSIGSLAFANGGRSDGFGGYVHMGGGTGLDVSVRLARMLLLGGSFDVAALTAPSQQTVAQPVNNFDAKTVTGSAIATYVGVTLGIIPNVDRISFVGDLGVGQRRVSRSLRFADKDPQFSDSHVEGLDFTLGAGVSIPVAAFRIVPKVIASLGSFSTVQENDDTPREIAPADRGAHYLIFVGVGAYYSVDFGGTGAKR